MSLAMQPLDTLGVELAGTHLIEASAGTGKTYAISTLFLRCLLEKELAVEEILVVTYTRAATAELRDRIRKRLREMIAAIDAGHSEDPSIARLLEMRGAYADRDRKRLLLALRTFDQASIFTIHGFCQRALTDSAFESGAPFDAEFETDGRGILSEVADDFWAREMFEIDAPFFAYLQEQGFDRRALHDLCAKVASDSDLQVLPLAAPDLSKSEKRADAFASCYRRMQACWRERRTEIIQRLLDSDLKQNSYKPKQIHETYVPAVDALLAKSQPTCISEEHRVAKLAPDVLAEKTKKNKAPPHHAFFDLVGEFVSLSAEQLPLYEARFLELKLRAVDYARSELVARKERRGVISFDDLLVQLRAALRGQQGAALVDAIRQRYLVALIDEFQDTDPIQYEVFRRIYHDSPRPGATLFLIGDPKQAIYGFRGADLYTYFAARRDAGARLHTLDTNYRSSPAMIESVNKLFGGAKDSFLFDELPFHPVKAAPQAEDRLVDRETGSVALEILLLERINDFGRDTTKRKGGRALPMSKDIAQSQITRRIAGEVLRLLQSDASLRLDHGERRVRPSDVAILVRTNRQALKMQEALRFRGIPSVLESDSSVFTTPEAAEVERILAAMVEPGKRNAIKSALATPLLGKSGNDLFDLQEDEAGWDEIVQSFRRWHDTWTQRGFIQAFSEMLRDSKMAERLLVNVDGPRRMTNVQQLAELLQARATASGAGPQSLCAWLATMRSDADARAELGDDGQLRLETDADAVKVVTVHKSKGLEYPIVFVPFAWDGNLLRPSDLSLVRFHDEDDDNRLKLDIGSGEQAEHIAASTREALAEELRLLYVALTRSVHRCVLVCGGLRSVGSSALGYLLLRDDALSTEADALAAFAEEIEGLEDEALFRRLQKKSAEVGDTLAMRSLVRYRGDAYRAEEGDAAALNARKAQRAIALHSRSSSFSALTSGGDHERDHDANTALTAVELATLVSESNEEAVDSHLAELPKGAHPGQMLHHIFEHADFRAGHPETSDAASLDDCIAASLDSFGFDRERWHAPLCESYRQMLQTPLVDGLRLCDLKRSQRLDELEFFFPVRERGAPFNAAILTDALATRKDAPWPAHYLASVQALGFAPLSGFLKGFIDMVFVHEDTWYLVDYKSNFLGKTSADYHRDAMAASMAEHHYFLQYHFYLVALDRFLRLRAEGYDYERNFGGVLYLYLRGMAPSYPAGSGVFYDRPDVATVRALDSALRGEVSE